MCLRLCALMLLMAAGCSGPAAPDAALCRDTIHRLCLAPRCSQVDATLTVDDSCEAELLTRTGCESDAFTFTNPTRTRFIACRAGLTNTGSGVETHPDCLDVSDMFGNCGDLVSFLNGVTK